MKKIILYLLFTFILSVSVSAVTTLFEDWETGYVNGDEPIYPYWYNIDNGNYVNITSKNSSSGTYSAIIQQFNTQTGKLYVNRSDTGRSLSENYQVSALYMKPDRTCCDASMVVRNELGGGWRFGDNEGGMVVMHSNGQWYTYCNTTWQVLPTASNENNIWYNVTMEIFEDENYFNILINSSRKIAGCQFEGAVTNTTLIGFANDYTGETFVDDITITSFLPDSTTAEWDALTPANDTFINDDTTFFYELTNAENVNCSFYHNRSGSLTLNQSISGLLNSGTQNFNDTLLTDEVADVLYQVRCTELGVDTANTSVKTIHVDRVNVLIDILSPVNNTDFDENTTTVVVDIQYRNTNLEDVYYRLYHPNSTLWSSQTNESLSLEDFNITEIVSLPSDPFGLWTLEVWGNDSSANEENKTHYFTILNNDISLSWVGLSPVNDSLIHDTTFNFNYNINLSNVTSANCTIYEDNVLNSSATITVSGSYSLPVSYGLGSEYVRDYKINCTYDNVLDETTGIKQININVERRYGFLSLVPLMVMGFFVFFIIRLVTKK